jgi:cyanophycinase
VIDRASAGDPTLAAVIARANFVYLSGGKPDYLYRTLAGSLAWDAVRAVLAGGGLLAGCSAGAMIFGEKFFGFPGWNHGFGFLPGATILPHFDEISQAMIRSLRALTGRDTILLGIEGNTALVGRGKQYEVVGSGGVTVWSRTGRTRYTRGPLPYWREG